MTDLFRGHPFLCQDDDFLEAFSGPISWPSAAVGWMKFRDHDLLRRRTLTLKTTNILMFDERNCYILEIGFIVFLMLRLFPGQTFRGIKSEYMENTMLFR